jgi:hypothetical protein
MFKVNDKVKILRAKDSCWGIWFPASGLIGEIGIVKKYLDIIRVEILTGYYKGETFSFEHNSRALSIVKTIKKII